MLRFEVMLVHTYTHTHTDTHTHSHRHTHTDTPRTKSNSIANENKLGRKTLKTLKQKITLSHFADEYLRGGAEAVVYNS